MSKKDFNLLLEKYVLGTLSPEEKEELSLLLHSPANEADLKALIDEKFGGTSFREKPSPEISSLIFRRIIKAKQQEAYTEPAYTPVRRIATKTKNRSWAYAAAAVIILLGAGMDLQVYRGMTKKDSVAAQTFAPGKRVAPPSSAKAAITLANGEVIELDSASNGTLAVQGNVSVIRLADGQLAYRHQGGENNPTKEPVFNTLSVPRGSRVVNIMLSDGTRVWLNAASSLRYPAAFIAGDDRKVEVTGKVYFEVAPMPVKTLHGKIENLPFIVKIGDGTAVRVLGTHFNIQSYPDDPSTAVTLLEGSIKLSHGDNTRMLTPGQQAKLNAAGSIALSDRVDIEHVMAWKNGYFMFDGAGIKDVMQQMARWYDVDIVYEGAEIVQHFRGNISRNVDAAKVFRMLEATGEVHFKIEDRKIIVNP